MKANTTGVGPWRDRLAGWPWLLFWPVFALCYFTLGRVPGRVYAPIGCALDEAIPFCEWFAIPYFLWHIAIAASVAVSFFRDKALYRRVMKYYMTVFSVSALVFALYPTCVTFRPEVLPRENPLTGLVEFLYTIDACTNVCPSLHVSGAVGAGLGLYDLGRPTLARRLGYGVLVGLICLSTVFLRQHSLIDVLWGLALGGAAWWAVYRKAGVRGNLVTVS